MAEQAQERELESFVSFDRVDFLSSDSWSWKEIGRLGQTPTARHGTHGEYMYLYGGYGPDGYHLHDFFRYNFSSHRWQKLEVEEDNSPGRRHSGVGFAWRGKFFVHGGAGPKSVYYDDMWCFDIAGHKWSKVAYASEAFPSGRWGHCVALIGDILYLFGGYATANIVNELWALDLTTNEWKKMQPHGMAPIPTHYGRMVAYKNKIYLFGGFDGFQNTTSVYAYNTEENTWKQVSSEMPPMRGYTCSVYKDCCYLFGGFSPLQRLLNTMIEYNFETNKWSQLATHGEMIPQRSFCDFQFHNARLYVFGGIGPRNLDDFYMFTFESDGAMSADSVGVDLSRLLDSPLFSDVTFKLGARSFHAHKAILHSRSSHFRGLFNSGMKESRAQVINLPDIDADAFALLLEFLYTGQVKCRPEQLTDLLIVADQFVVPSLKDHCEKSLSKGIVESTVCELAEFAANYHANNLLVNCFVFVANKKIDAELLSNDVRKRYSDFVKNQLDSVTKARVNFVRLPDSSRLPRRLPVGANAAANQANNPNANPNNPALAQQANFLRRNWNRLGNAVQRMRDFIDDLDWDAWETRVGAGVVAAVLVALLAMLYARIFMGWSLQLSVVQA